MSRKLCLFSDIKGNKKWNDFVSSDRIYFRSSYFTILWLQFLTLAACRFLGYSGRSTKSWLNSLFKTYSIFLVLSNHRAERRHLRLVTSSAFSNVVRCYISSTDGPIKRWADIWTDTDTISIHRCKSAANAQGCLSIKKQSRFEITLVLFRIHSYKRPLLISFTCADYLVSTSLSSLASWVRQRAF